MCQTKDFYDELSSVYHLIFEDWDATIQRQAAILSQIIQSEWQGDISTIADVSCGIGTQAIGLAKLGYQVDASDLSPQAIARAEHEAQKRGVAINFSVADMRHVSANREQAYDLVISCDNSVPHLLSDEAILTAFRAFYQRLKPGGGCLLTVRDYAQENCSGTQIKPYGIRIAEGIKYIVFQTWEFHGDLYDLSMYFIRDDGTKRAETAVFRAQYYAVSTAKISELLGQVGFINVKLVESNFYQPVIVGTKG